MGDANIMLTARRAITRTSFIAKAPAFQRIIDYRSYPSSAGPAEPISSDANSMPAFAT
jgi:hypothetical protein